MHELIEISKALAGIPSESLVSLVALAGLGVAAFAIYAVLSLTKERH